MIPFQCAGCGKNLQVKDEVAGKKVKCPGCGRLVHAPEALATPAPGPQGPNPPGRPLSGAPAGPARISQGSGPALQRTPGPAKPPTANRVIAEQLTLPPGDSSASVVSDVSGETFD